jgi:diacylglycerol kinase family enzyme
MKAIVVYNDQAGQSVVGTARPDAAALHTAFAAAGIDADLRGARGEAIQKTLRDAAGEKPAIMYVGGGDGTISTAAGILAGGSTVLGVLPLGTLNHFARDLGIPLAWPEAIRALAVAPVRAVDVAEVNGRVFINNCSIGSYADAVRRRDALRRQKGHGKWLAMFLASWTVFLDLRRLRLQITSPETSRSLRTPFVLVANNRYSGRVLDSSLRPRVNEGRLWLYTTRAHRHGALLRLAWQSLVRRIDAADALEMISTTEVNISTPQATLPVAADGEVLSLKPPLQFKIRPAALRVLTPISDSQ